MRRRIVGQTDAIDAIVPYVELFDAGLAPEGRPLASSSCLVRPVPARLALSRPSPSHPRLRAPCPARRLRRIPTGTRDAKLIGAPPGYLAIAKPSL